TLGEAPGEFTVGAADFPGARELRPWQRREQQLALASLVPAAAVAVGILSHVPYRVEVGRQAHARYTSNGRRKRSTTRAGRIGAGIAGCAVPSCDAKHAIARRLAATASGSSRIMNASKGACPASGSSQCQAHTG